MADSGGRPLSGDKLRKKITSLAAGEAHTLALAGDGRVFSWGRGTLGRLGTGSEEDKILPELVTFDSSKRTEKPRFVQVAAGAYHSLALQGACQLSLKQISLFLELQMMDQFGAGVTTSVSFIIDFFPVLVIFGAGNNGQLGLNLENSLVPRLLDKFLELGPDDLSTGRQKPLKVRSVQAGGMMSLAIDKLGGLWIWGNCPPQSSIGNGEFSLVSISTPLPVWDFYGHTVVKVACGNEHVVALVTAGETFRGGDLICYSWGGNNHGQLGLGDQQSRLRPELVETFNFGCPWEAYQVACGAFHTAVLTFKKDGNMLNSSHSGDVELEEKETICWTFGLGDNGQLGHGNTNTLLSPKAVDGLPPDVFLISVDCGLFHTSVVSSAGDVWSWGMEKGLGLCPDASFVGTDPGDALTPLRFSCDDGPTFLDPVQVVCGAAHTVLVAEKGYKLWAWGRGRSGVLGRGNAVDSYSPCLVMWPPLDEDFGIGTKSVSAKQEVVNKESGGQMDTEKKLISAMEQVQLLQSRLTVMEHYAGILHGSIFGKPLEEKDVPLQLLQQSSTFDIAKEWENILEGADNEKLAKMEMFFRNMLASLKNERLKRRIQEMIKDCLQTSQHEAKSSK
ncbi:hypothetical protein Sjap_011496 [Stephania japonica]|uniref:Ultraviolet-B receptor UVR8 n=1 Tax=Stephania japonica TaxID=461633 RepID=A0AAP0JBH6_9MAGN